nr:MAG TPA: hypothetical protein [Caudoviricetes sp.]
MQEQARQDELELPWLKLLISFYFTKILCVVFRTRKGCSLNGSWAVARNTFYRPTKTLEMKE